MNDPSREDMLRPFMKKGPDWGGWLVLFGVFAVAAALVAFLTAGWWAPCSWFGGVSLKNAPLRCVEEKRR